MKEEVSMLMRTFLAMSSLLVVGAVLPSAQAAPQDESAGNSMSVTGCLQKGDERGEFSITGEDGKKYGLRSTAVKLSSHVGHKVTVTGQMKKEENEESEKNEKKEESSKEAGDLNVTALKMISKSCP